MGEIHSRVPLDLPQQDDSGSADPLPIPPQGDIDCGLVDGEHLELQIRRGTTAERTAMVPLVGEPVYDTEEKRIYVGDGVTPGGVFRAVTSVNVSIPGYTSGGAVTGGSGGGAGTVAMSASNQAVNTVLAGPATGSAAAPGFRALVSGDIPALGTGKITGLDSALAEKVAGPASVTDERAAVFDGTTGKLLKQAGFTITGLLSRANHLGTQTAASISDFATAALEAVTWSSITGKPSTFAPETHTHGAGDITAGTLDAARLPTVPVAKGGTGATDASEARAALGLAIGTHVQAFNTLLASIAGLWTSVTKGRLIAGSGAGTVDTLAPGADGQLLVADSEEDLGVKWSDLDVGAIVTGVLPVVHGGTGADSISAARASLGLVPGTDVQVYDADLTAIAGLTSAANKLPYATGAGTWAMTDLTAAGRALLDDADAAAQRTTLGVAPGTDVQAYDADLAAIAGLTSAANKLPYFTGSGTAALADISAAGRALIDDADAAAQRATLGLVPGTNVQAYDAELAAIAGLASSADRVPYFTGSGTAALATLTTSARAVIALAIAKGDLIAGTGPDAADILAVGTDGQVLTADSGEATGMKWADASTGSGTVTSVNITAPAAGITATGGPVTASGSITLALADDLAALEALAGTGIVRRTGSNTWSAGTAVGLTTEVTGTLPVGNGGTGATTASAARTAMGLEIGTNVQAWDTDLDAYAGLSSTGIVRRLGSGSASAGTAVGLTTEVTGTLPVGNGGTGATTASAARTALGLAIGTDVQAYDADLAAIAALSPSSGNVITWNGSAWTAAAPSGGGDRAIAQCRLSLDSTLAVSGNKTGAGDVYLHRYRGNRIAVYSGSGSTWTELTLGSSAISLSLTSFTTAGRPVDIFVSNSGGSPVLNGIAWSSSTTRATSLTLQDGIYVNSADLTQRYVGSVCIVSSGVADDNETNRYCWSMFNQVDRVAIAKEPTDTWTYTTATFREIRAGAGGAGASRVNILKGLAEPIDVSVKGLAISTTTVSVACGVGVNSDTNLSPVFGTQAISTGYVSVIAAYRGELPEGANNVRMLEYSVATGTTTWGGDVGIPSVLQSGMWVCTRQ